MYKEQVKNRKFTEMLSIKFCMWWKRVTKSRVCQHYCNHLLSKTSYAQFNRSSSNAKEPVITRLGKVKHSKIAEWAHSFLALLQELYKKRIWLGFLLELPQSFQTPASCTPTPSEAGKQMALEALAPFQPWHPGVPRQEHLCCLLCSRAEGRLWEAVCLESWQAPHEVWGHCCRQRPAALCKRGVQNVFAPSPDPLLLPRCAPDCSSEQPQT